jgi:aspartate/methionine/tyrosine aminotransferase
MKAAWLVTSGPLLQKAEALSRLEIISDTYLSVSAPVQLAVPGFLSQRHAFHEQMILRIRENLAELDRQLPGQKSCGRLSAEGGWCAVLRILGTRSDEESVIDLLNTKGVLVHPDHFYDFPTSGHLIVSTIIPVSDFSRGVAEILAFLS